MQSDQSKTVFDEDVSSAKWKRDQSLQSELEDLPSRSKVDLDERRDEGDFSTVYNRDPERNGFWFDLTPRVKIKLLHVNLKLYTCSLFMQVQPGVEWLAHRQYHAEECLVINGEIMIGDSVIKKGDFHFAPKGVLHGAMYSKTGALLLLNMGLRDIRVNTTTYFAYIAGFLKHKLLVRRVQR